MTNTIQRLQAIPLENITIETGFWGERQATNRDRTIPAIYKQMKDTGRLDAWRLDWKIGQAPKQLTAASDTEVSRRLDGRTGQIPKPHIFWDSDAGKWIEAVGYSLTNHPSPEFEKQVDEVIELIEKAQQPDGYLNIFFTSVEPENRWKNLRDWHELYDAGHLIEGAIAYYNATGKRKLLDVLCRYVDLINAKFGPNEGQKRAYDGHPEIELALVKLYHETGDEKYLNLSKYFIDERGQQPHFFDQETIERGDDPRNFWAKTYRYCQADKPIREQTTAVGHSVRAAYLFSGVADIAAETSDSALENAARSVWNDLTQHQMYVTGGLGPAHTNEGFTFAYDLPNETAYAETCASIALVFWAQRMFHLDPKSSYIDVMERALYNGVMSGVSYEGG
ncbi:MAG TPA: beta-L-arabinofuranosidase domain-containing protein, partial [Terriglobales bacterium]|nr:beta-L-arabinofuranosidase domain-containing protein [Terriglobales bacterium]